MSPWRVLKVFLGGFAVVAGLLALLGWWETGRSRQEVVLSPGDYPPESVTYVNLHRYGVHRYRTGIYLVRHEGRIHALWPVSSWGGLPVSWDEREGLFRDTNGAVWDREGRRIAGAASRNLDWFPVRIDGNAIRVDVTALYCGYPNQKYTCGPGRRSFLRWGEG